MQNNLVMYSTKGTDIDSLLAEIGSNDNDLNGYNGDEYLWSEAKESGFSTNLEWLLDQVKKINDVDLKVGLFLKWWFSHDYYYKDYKYNVEQIEVAEKNLYVLSVAVLTNDY